MIHHQIYLSAELFFSFLIKKNLVENIYEFFDGCVELYEDYRTFIW